MRRQLLMPPSALHEQSFLERADSPGCVQVPIVGTIPNDIAFHSHLRDIEPVRTRSCDMKIVLAESATLICQRHSITARCQLLVPCSY